MPTASNLKNVMEDIVSSYEAKIESIGSLFDSTHLILSEFQESLLDSRPEREQINAGLRDALAGNEHLRNKDFDHMMQGILLAQDGTEREVRALLRSYCGEQKEMAQRLRENLDKFRDSLAKGEAQRVKRSHALIAKILTKQDKRKKEVTSKLREFQEQQKALASRLKELLAKGRELRIKDLKSMLSEFKSQQEERMVGQEQRREGIRSKLGDFKREREGMTTSRRAGRKKVSREVSKSSEAISTAGSGPSGPFGRSSRRVHTGVQSAQ